MRVLMFGWEFPPHISGGLGTACLGITSALLNKMISVLFVVPHLFGDEDRGRYNLLNASQILKENSAAASGETGMSYFKVNSTLRPYMSAAEFKSNGAPQHGHRITNTDTCDIAIELYGPNLLKEVLDYTQAASLIVSENKFDMIHAHDWLTFPAGMLAKEVTGKPLIVHVHATEFDRSGENINPEIFEIEKNGILAADKVIAVSAHTKNILIERYRIDPEKIEVVHNGIMAAMHSPAQVTQTNAGEKIVSFLGRITFQKGPDYFVEAARKLLDRLPDVHFVIAGTGDMLYPLIRRVAELRMATRFHFVGFIDEAERDRLFAMSDVYVMPSVSEPFGLSTLEAMQAGVPVVISRQSGVSEVVTNAVKVDFWDIDALANAIFGLLEYPALSTTFVRENRKEMKNLSWDATAEKISGIYRSLLNQQAS